MTDKQLLELAAKAANIIIDGFGYADFYSSREGEVAHIHYIGDGRKFSEWNPLTDDGDALRLAVKLGMTVYVDTHPSGCECTEVNSVTYPSGGHAVVNHEACPASATRRAIVICAAEIGKGM